MSGRYAKDTVVPAERSRQEIERLVERYGATAFDYGWEEGNARLMFELGGYRIHFKLPMPSKDDEAFRWTSQRRPRSPTAQQELWEQEVRRRWRAMKLIIQANLEAIELGLMRIEEAFLNNVVIPGGAPGETVGQWIRPQLELSYRTGHMPAALPDLVPVDPQPLPLPAPKRGA